MIVMMNLVLGFVAFESYAAVNIFQLPQKLAPT